MPEMNSFGQIFYGRFPMTFSTPLTSISGNASNLLSNGKSFDEDTKLQLYTDIYDDSMWLINLVENLARRYSDRGRAG